MSKMELSSERGPKGLRVALKGSLDVFSYLDLKRLLEDQVRREEGEKVLIDLRLADYVASSGWAVLTSAAKQLSRARGRLVIFGMAGEVARVYETMGISPLLKSAATEAEALEIIESP